MALRRAVESLRRDFPSKSYSWVRRALMRLGDVREVRDGLYVVYGRRELGDWKPLYQVWLSERGAVGYALVISTSSAIDGGGGYAPTWLSGRRTAYTSSGNMPFSLTSNSLLSVNRLGSHEWRLGLGIQLLTSRQ